MTTTSKQLSSGISIFKDMRFEVPLQGLSTHFLGRLLACGNHSQPHSLGSVHGAVGYNRCIGEYALGDKTH